MQKEAKRIILGTTKDTPTETTRFMPDLPPVQTRQKVKQVKAYFSAVENPHIPFHEALKDTKGCRLGRGKSWMGQIEDSILQVCQARELKQTKEWERYPKENTPARRLGTALPKKDSRQNGVRYQASHSRKQQIVVYTDGSVTTDQSGWGFTVKRCATTVHEHSAAYTVSY